MIDWIDSTSGSTALRVVTIGPLQGDHLLPCLPYGLLDAVRRRASVNVVAGDYVIRGQALVDSGGEFGAEALEFVEREIDQLAAFFQALLHRLGDDLVGFAKGHAVAGQIGGGGEGVHEAGLAGGPHAAGVEIYAAHEACGDFQAILGGDRAFKKRLLHFLQIFVVGERQALHGDGQRHLVADDSGGLAANQLQRVRVFLLRHGAASRRIRLGQQDEAVLGGGKQNELLGPAAQVDGNHRERVDELDGEVAVAGGVHAVGGGAAEVN